MNENQDLKNKASLVRKWCLVSTTSAGSGHPTTCLSSADLATVLFDNFFSYDIKNPESKNNDKLIFSKGHAAPLFYTLFSLSGAFSPEKLRTLRKFDSDLEGHPTPRFPFTVSATGSLGQGLSVGSGTALSGKKDNLSFKTYVLLGDGEMAEGNVWEAANFASFYKLNNLIAILDVNRLGQSQETMFGVETSEYEKRFKAFGWETVVIDGHNHEQIQDAFEQATNNKTQKPFIIIAKTVKGKGVSFIEDKDGWHGKALKKDELERALKELGEINDSLRFKLQHRTSHNLKENQAEEQDQLSTALEYKKGEEVATREAFGQTLAELGKENSLIYSLDGDTKNSTFAEDFKNVSPDRFVECFIAEQNMAALAVGLSKTGKIPFVSTFAAFLTRAFDQIRMAGISKANIKFVGSHAGISIGEDGPSQMALEDFAMFGAIPESVIIHPSDAASTARLIPCLLLHQGISYLRTLRPKTPVLYDKDEEFQVGGSKILKKSEKDLLTVAACGITVYEALKAYEELKKEGISIRIVDCYCLKPLDKKTLEQCSNKTIKPIIITVEDHYEHGGLGDFVLSALSGQNVRVEKMAVGKLPRSGTKEELLDYEEISAKHIVKRVKDLTGN